MSEELEVRIGKDSGLEFTILARHADYNGNKYVWYLAEGDTVPASAAESYLYGFTKPKPTFFEEKKTYQGPHPDFTYTVHYVHEMANGLIAVAQTTNGVAALLRPVDWRSGLYVKVR